MGEEEEIVLNVASTLKGNFATILHICSSVCNEKQLLENSKCLYVQLAFCKIYLHAASSKQGGMAEGGYQQVGYQQVEYQQGGYQQVKYQQFGYQQVEYQHSSLEYITYKTIK
jgi:hypothetical protein